jgi:uncharacterized iron-regulated membrane protein
MFGNDLLHRPQSLLLRRFLFQIHLWVGIAVGLYMFLMGVTGSALVFREELEQRADPALYPRVQDGTALAPITDVIRNIEITFPNHRVRSVYSPSRTRPVYYGFIEQNGQSRTVLASSTGDVLGERPPTGLIRGLQDLHVNLLYGRTGRIVNGFGAILLLVLSATGAAIWWPGLDAWRKNLRVDFRKNWKRVTWELHSATGFWTVAVVAMWAFTGAYFTFPQPFQRVVNKVSRLTPPPAPSSSPSEGRRQVDLDVLVRRSLGSIPGGQVAGVVLPATERSAVVVQISRGQPDHMDNSGYVYFTYDQYSGSLLSTWDQLNRSTGDALLSWIQPLHYGNFAGLPLKLLWVLLGLSPPVLFTTAAIMWWNRVLRRRWQQLSAPVTLS